MPRPLVRCFHVQMLKKNSKRGVPAQYCSFRSDPEVALREAMESVGGKDQSEFALLEMLEEVKPKEFVIAYSNRTRMFSDHGVDDLEDIANRTDLLTQDDLRNLAGVIENASTTHTTLALVPKDEPVADAPPVVEKPVVKDEDIYVYAWRWSICKGDHLEGKFD